MVEREESELNRTLFSAIVSLEGDRVGEMVEEWEGNIQWIAQSPYRIYHKRKKWFIGIKSFTPKELSDIGINISPIRLCAPRDRVENMSIKQNRLSEQHMSFPD